MTPEQIEELGPAFADYLQQFLFCCDYTQTFDLLGVYCRGLLSDLDRKTCEPIALVSGAAVRTLQEFLRDHHWSFEQTRTTLQQHVARTLPMVPADDLGTVGLHDETGTKKQGRHTPGVRRQHCGELGKIENCLVTVHTGVARGRYKTLLDADLFLPESWDHDRDRCRQAHIPDDLHYRPKWQLALTQLDRVRPAGIPLDWLTFDEGYGDKPGYLQGLDQRQQRYVGEVPKSFRCLGRPPRPGQRASRADDRGRHSPCFMSQPWQVVRLPRQTLGDQQWQVKATRVYVAWGGEQTYWLVWARQPKTGEEKYFVSNAAADEPVERIVRAAFCRWNVEHGLRLSKSEIGFRHFEGRSYVALMRHLMLCCVTLTFVAGEAAALRGEKPRGDRGAGVPGVELGVRGVAGGVTGDAGVAVHLGRDPLSPEAKPSSPRVTAAPATRLARGVHEGGVTPHATPPTKKSSTTAKSFTLAL
jgi:SRSO17 transposase